MKEIKYQFIPVPLNLFYCMDNNCSVVLTTLIQLSFYYESKSQGAFDGWFYRTNALLESATNMSRRVLNGALDALYQRGIIGIIPQPKGKGSNQGGRKYKVYFDSFKAYEDLDIDECSCKNPDYGICTLDYKSSVPSFQRLVAQGTAQQAAQDAAQSRNNIDGINNIESINNRNIIDKTENNILNNSYLENLSDTIQDSILREEKEKEKKEEVNDSELSHSKFCQTTSAGDLEATNGSEWSASNISKSAALDETPYCPKEDSSSDTVGHGVGERVAPPPSEEEAKKLRRKIDDALQIVAAWETAECDDEEIAQSHFNKAQELFSRLEPNHDEEYYEERARWRIERIIAAARTQGIRVMELPI